MGESLTKLYSVVLLLFYASIIIYYRFVSADDHQWFHMTTKRLVKEELGMEYMTAIEGDPSYFVNFLR